MHFTGYDLHSSICVRLWSEINFAYLTFSETGSHAFNAVFFFYSDLSLFEFALNISGSLSRVDSENANGTNNGCKLKEKLKEILSLKATRVYLQ